MIRTHPRQRHPQTEGLLPAEAGGMIAVGDALVGCNGYSLQGMDLEQAVGVMRSVGTPPSGPSALYFSWRLRCLYTHEYPLGLVTLTFNPYTKTKHHTTQGEVTLRFRRAPQAGGDARARLPRVPSIYGLDFAGGGKRRPPLPLPLPPQPALPLLEPDHRQGFVLTWHLCGRGELKRDGGGGGGGGLRLDAAALVCLPDEEEEGGGRESKSARRGHGGKAVAAAAAAPCASRSSWGARAARWGRGRSC